MTGNGPAGKKQHEKPHDEFRHAVEARRRRKMRALRHGDRSVWFGLGMFGVVGWAVVVPALLFTALGIWLDSTLKRQYSWTLMLLVIGVMAGCLNAWFWVNRERREIEKEQRNYKEDKDAS